MAIFLTKDNKVIVQGITGSEATTHTARMLKAGTQIVGGVNARKAGTTVSHKDVNDNDIELPVFGTVVEAIEKTGADVSIIFVPPKFAKDAIIEAIDAEIPLLVVITEGIPVQDSAFAWAYNVEKGNKTRIIGNGAGLVMSTLDVVAYAGEKHGGVKPANFLDIGGGASAEVMAAGLDVILGDSQVKSVFVNVFGGITACDAVANGIVQALEILGDEANKPLVVRLDGNNVDEGRRILAEANHPLVTEVGTMDEAADVAAAKAAEAANA